MLRPLAVVNPWADQLTFLDDRTRTRRDHEKYLTLIDTITLLHQYQRPIKTAVVADKTIEYIEATLSDIALAIKIAHEVLGVSLDELPPQTRRVLAGLHSLVQGKIKTSGLAQRDIRFMRGEVRMALNVSEKQIRVHLERLAAMEYVLVHRGQRGQSFEYELLHDQREQAMASAGAHLSGLIDVAALQTSSESTATKPGSWGQGGQFVGPSCPQRGVNVAASRATKTAARAHEIRRFVEMPDEASDSSTTPHGARTHVVPSTLTTFSRLRQGKRSHAAK